MKYFDLDLVKCDNSEVFVDIGAYTGDTILDYINTYREYKSIYAYEITPSSIDYIKQNLSIYPNIYIRNNAATDKEETLYIKNNSVSDSANTLDNTGEIQVQGVTIDDDVFEFQGPVMNGSNPVKDNSMSQQRLWNCQCRLFVKAVAIHTGLGFDLWVKNEDTESKEAAQTYTHDIRKVKDQVNQLITAIQKESSMSLADIAEKMNRSEAELKTWIRQYDILYAFEHNLEVILKGIINDKKS